MTALAMARPAAWLGLLGAGALALYAAMFADAYGLRILAIAGCYAILVMGYQFVFGQLGVLSLAQGAFFGLGAYTAAILSAGYGLSFPITFSAAIAISVLAAALVAVPVLRLETHYFALATLVLAQASLLAALHAESLTGGANGLPGVPDIRVGGWSSGKGFTLTLLVWGAVGAAAWLAHRSTSRARALALACLRERPMAAAALGLDAMQARFGAFLLSAAFGGAAGALHAHVVGVVSPESLELPVMIACLSMAVVGGRTRVVGAVLGALLLAHLPEWFREFERLYLLLYGLALLGFVIALPEGLAGAFARLTFPRKSSLAVPAPDAAPPDAQTEREGRTLALEHVTKRFGGITALEDVSLELRPGEILALIGPNGSGKSTFLSIATGFLRPDGGTVRWGDANITARPPHEIARLGIARNFQATELLGAHSALDNVALAVLAREGARHLSSWRPRRAPDLDAARDEARTWLRSFDATSFEDRTADALPAGARRLVECARAAALRPRALVLDEPGAGLSGAEKTALAGRLRALGREGTAVLLVDHDMAFLFAAADRVACLDRGRLIALGAPSAVRADPAVVAAYLGAAP